jgi:hypothetical protein
MYCSQPPFFWKSIEQDGDSRLAVVAVVDDFALRLGLGDVGAG